MKRFISMFFPKNKDSFKFCPHCGSTDLKITATTGFVAVGALAMYHCNNCQLEVLPFEGDSKFIADYLHKLRTIKAMGKSKKPGKQKGGKKGKKKKR